MLKPEIEEAIEMLYIHETEAGPYPSGPAFAAALQEACSLGVVEPDGEEYRFTPYGLPAGRDVVRRHRLAERLLADVLRVKNQDLEGGACRFEHVLQQGIEERVCSLLGHPATCPHGKVIPEGECCRRAREDHIREVSPLCDGQPGAEGVVAYLSTQDNRDAQKLMAMGVLPGSPVTLLRRFPSYVLQVGYSQFTLDRSLAEMIYVHWRPAAAQPAADAPFKGTEAHGKGRRRRWGWRIG